MFAASAAALAAASETPRMALAPSRALLGVPSSLRIRLVEAGLVLGIEAAQGIEDLGVDRVHRLLDALAAIAVGIAVAQLYSLMGSGRGTRGHGGPAEAAVLKRHIDLDGGIAAAVQDFAGGDINDGCHGSLRA